MGCFFPDAVEDEEPQAFLDADVPAADTHVFQGGGYLLVGTFMLFPYADVGAYFYQLVQPLRFKGGAYISDLAFGGNDGDHCPLAWPPADACEILHGGAGVQDEGFDLVFG